METLILSNSLLLLSESTPLSEEEGDSEELEISESITELTSNSILELILFLN
jgi:hypothetical protein